MLIFDLKMKTLLLFLLLGLSECGESYEAQLWWYGSYGAHSKELLSFKDKVKLQSFTENVTWNSPTCTITDLSQNPYTVELLCSRPGLHMVNIERIDANSSDITESTAYIPLENSPYCYLWKVQFSELQGNTSNIQVLAQVWVGSASEDSAENDQELTVLFHSLGEQPEVSFIHHAEGSITSLDYNSISKRWEFEIETALLEFAVTVTRGNTAIMDCGIRSTKHIFYNSPLTSNVALSVSAVPDNFTVSSAEVPPTLFKDWYSHGVAVIIHSGVNFITVDGFDTIKTFQVVGISGAIQEVAFTLSTLCIISDGELFILPVEGSAAVRQTGIPADVIEHVSARGYSDGGGGLSEDLVVIWSHNQTGAIFLSRDGGFNFDEISLSSLGGTVASVLLHPMHKEINVLVVLEEDNMQAKFLHYDVDTQEWKTESLNFSSSGGNLTAVFFPSEFGELLVWEDTALYYSPNKGITVRSLPLYTSDGSSMTPFSLHTEAYVQHVSVGPSGQFTVLCHDNHLFYGTTGVGYAVEIQSGVSPASQAVVSFDLLSELKLILFQDNGVSIRKVPTYSLLLSSLYPPPACPYLQWSNNIAKSVYYLDSTETLTLWASVIPRPWQSNEISFTVSDPSGVSYHAESQLVQTAIEGSIERNMSVHIQPSQMTVNGSNKLTAIKFSVSSKNLACPDSTEAVTQLSIQCPPSRHIEIKRPSGYSNQCPSFENLVYKISKNNYDPGLRGRRHVRGDEDKEVSYNHSLYGCPVRVPYTQRFRPTLELYDGTQLVREVDADFVLWEIHGRTDFQYTATAETAGCASSPQSWTKMTQDGLYPTIAWTPQTYRDCFQSGGRELNRKAAYQIFNSTGVSYLSWYGHNGIYIFTVTIVANEYSFCNLSATFAVEVYGAIKNSYVGYIFLVLTCVSGMLVLVVSYYCYRYKTGRHEKKE